MKKALHWMLFAVSLGCMVFLALQRRERSSDYARQSSSTSNAQRKGFENRQLRSTGGDGELVILINQLREQNPELNRQQIITLTKQIADPERRLNLIGSLPDDYRIWVLGEDFDELVRKNTGICAAWLLSFKPEKDIHKSMAVRIFSELCASDFGRSLNSLSVLTQEQRSLLLRNGLFHWLQEVNPETAMSEIGKRLSGDDYNTAVRSVCIASIGKDPVLAYDLARDSQNGIAPELLGEIYHSLIKSGETGYFVKDIASLDPKVLQSVLENRENMAALMARASKETKQALSSLPVSQDNIGILENAAETLAEENADKAIEWVGTLEATPRRSDLIAKVYEKWAARDLGAAEGAARSSAGEIRNAAMRGIGGTIGETKLEDGIAMLPQLEGADREAFFSGLVKGVGKTGPKMLIKLVMDERVSNNLVDSANTWNQFNGAVMELAANDQAVAIEYFNSFNEESRSKSIDGLIRGWSKSDAVAACEWLMQQPAGELKNIGIRSIIGLVEKADPDAAKQWQSLLKN